ncbi:type IV pilus assembly protein PilC [Desulfocicer vacuolatum DSM 3385]|uniref:Type IV pilus assembly protein PilC n=1 Tax=Desulfocicer vacuolatum DSM 3385 TaxID=1121400 RepID=A0A1W1ZPE2_9BACT|nr:type II secretion system F family protein [Desulfocicer vacuolatum]SMC50082.1 type IV pilus assembly protein PilC [Desulfocicer vacuolatum DSM 3385]
MPTYRCKIATSDGYVVERVIAADTIDSIKAQLVKDGTHLVSARKSAGTSSFFSFKSQIYIKSKAFYAFNQELSVLLKAGLPVVTAFDNILLKKKQHHGFYKLLGDIRNDIASGESVSGAVGKYSHIFSPLYVASLKAGESGGDLPGAIFNYLAYIRKTDALKQKVKAASIYPLILSVCSIFVVAFLIFFVVPAVTGSFVETGRDLPFFTTLLLNITDFVKRRYGLMGMGVVLIFCLGYFFLRWERSALIFDRFLLRVPFVGEIITCYFMARFSATLSTMLSSGNPLNLAVRIASGLVGNRYMHGCIMRALHGLEQGVGFADSLESTGVFPNMAISMIAAGEEGGSLESVLMDVAKFYDTDIENKLTMITSSLEPLLMVIMGVIIGFIVLAMYMPIFQMAGTIG